MKITSDRDEKKVTEEVKWLSSEVMKNDFSISAGVYLGEFYGIQRSERSELIFSIYF